MKPSINISITPAKLALAVFLAAAVAWAANTSVDYGNRFIKGTLGVAQVATFQAADAGEVKVAGTLVPVSASIDGGTGATQRIAFGMGTLSSNELIVTFNPAFGKAPQCVCSTVQGTAAACGVSVVPSTTTGSFKGAGASDLIQWICIGDK